MNETNLEKLLNVLGWQGGTYTQVNQELLKRGYLGASRDFTQCSDTVVGYICDSIRRYDSGEMFKGSK